MNLTRWNSYKCLGMKVEFDSLKHEGKRKWQENGFLFNAATKAFISKGIRFEKFAYNRKHQYFYKKNDQPLLLADSPWRWYSKIYTLWWISEESNNCQWWRGKQIMNLILKFRSHENEVFSHSIKFTVSCGEIPFVHKLQKSILSSLSRV